MCIPADGRAASVPNRFSLSILLYMLDPIGNRTSRCRSIAAGSTNGTNYVTGTVTSRGL